MTVFCDGSMLRAPDSGLLGLPCLCSSCSVVGTEVQSSITETYTVFLDEKLLSVTIWRFITPNPCLQVLYSASSTKSVLTCWLLTSMFCSQPSLCPRVIPRNWGHIPLPVQPDSQRELTHTFYEFQCQPFGLFFYGIIWCISTVVNGGVNNKLSSRISLQS